MTQIEFDRIVAEEVAIVKAMVRDDMPDWPWWFGFALGPEIPQWDEAVNPA